MHAKVDFVHDALEGQFNVDLREAYLDYSTKRFDFRLGRQIATWGVGDLLFINDLFPKDWVAFFADRPLEYLKIGVDGFRTRYSSPMVNVDVILIPVFTPDTVPTTPRFVLEDAFSFASGIDPELPEHTYGNTEVGLRLYRRIRDVDVSVYAYRGFWRTPSATLDESFDGEWTVSTRHPALSVYGMSVQRNAIGGVVSLEAGHYRSRDDVEGRDPFTPNSQARFLLGYQKQLWQDATVGGQYYAEIMADHATYVTTLPAGFPVQERYSDIVSLRVEQRLKHQTWELTLVAFYGRANAEYLAQPQVAYTLSDRLSVAVGANVVGGDRPWTPFARLARNDNVYASLRFDF